MTQVAQGRSHGPIFRNLSVSENVAFLIRLPLARLVKWKINKPTLAKWFYLFLFSSFFTLFFPSFFLACAGGCAGYNCCLLFPFSCFIIYVHGTEPSHHQSTKPISYEKQPKSSLIAPQIILVDSLGSSCFGERKCQFFTMSDHEETSGPSLQACFSPTPMVFHFHCCEICQLGAPLPSLQVIFQSPGSWTKAFKKVFVILPT